MISTSNEIFEKKKPMKNIILNYVLIYFICRYECKVG